MLSFNQYEVDLRSIPGEVCLTLYICDCPFHCANCSSPWLREHGKYLVTTKVIDNIIKKFPYVSCILFMGGDARLSDIVYLSKYISNRNLKSAMYSGNDIFDTDVSQYLDYYKVGSWQQEKGPLNCEYTNQKLYKKINNQWIDITHLFWTRENKWREQMQKNIKRDKENKIEK